MKLRYRIAQDFYSGLNRLAGWDWAVYDKETSDDYPMAVFASRADAVAYRATKEKKK